jgi:hypothetical protein
VAALGAVGGVAFGIHSYRAAQRHLERFDRVAVPGATTVELAGPTGRILYYEGDDDVRFGDLDLRVISPSGSAVAVRPYEGDMVYETLDLTKGRAIATFNAAGPGAYRIAVRGVAGGTIAVGDSFSRRALPGLLIGLGLAGMAALSGLTLWVLTFMSRRRTGQRRPLQRGLRGDSGSN